MKTIFHIEDRASDFIYHWLVFMVGGLRHIANGGSKWHIGSGRAQIVEQNGHLAALSPAKEPYLIYISCIDSNLLDFQRQTLAMIRDKFVLIAKGDICPDDVVVNNYGEHLITDVNDVSKEVYVYLQDLLIPLATPAETMTLYKKFFIRRGKAHLLKSNSGLKRRQIVNEQDVVSELAKHGIESIYLEDFTVADKVTLFNNAEVIISPNTGGLTFLAFSRPKTQIIEIRVQHPHEKRDVYSYLAGQMDLVHHNFVTRGADQNDNMIVDGLELRTFLQKIHVV